MKLDKKGKKSLLDASHQKKSQSVLDYTVFLVIIIATLFVMGYYIRNSLAQKHREAADTFGTGEVYSPNVTGATSDTTITSPPPTSVINQPSSRYMW